MGLDRAWPWGLGSGFCQTPHVTWQALHSLGPVLPSMTVTQVLRDPIPSRSLCDSCRVWKCVCGTRPRSVQTPVALIAEDFAGLVS